MSGKFMLWINLDQLLTQLSKVVITLLLAGKLLFVQICILVDDLAAE